MTELPWNKHGIFGCSRGYKCEWKCFTLDRDGIALGEVQSNAWMHSHDRICGGKLIQIIEPKKETT